MEFSLDDKSLASRLTGVAWVLLAGITVFPYLAGVVAMNDEVSLVYHFNGATSLSNEDIGRWVWTYKFFRPLDQFLAPYLVDGPSRSARVAMLLHLPGLIGLIAVVSYWTRRLIPREPIAVPIVILVLAFSTATSLSLWQLDTSTQTWSAAVGIWFCGLTWLATRALRDGREGPRAWLLVGVGALGLLTKETFLGWYAVALLILLASWLFDFRAPVVEKGDARSSWIRTLFAVATLPALFLVARLLSTTLGEVATQGEGHYGIHLGPNVIKNAALSVLGFLPNGPSHAVFGLTHAPVWVRALSPLAFGLCALLVAMPWFFSRLLKQDYTLTKRRELYVAALLCFLASAIVWPTRQISEVNLLGPNFGGALLIAAGVADTRRIFSNAGPSTSRLMFGRVVLWGTTLLAVLLLSLGLVSRGRQMAVSWEWVVTLKDSIRSHQASLRESEAGAGVFIPAACSGDGRGYSQIVVSPERALRPSLTIWWLNYENPTRKLAAYRLRPESRLTSRDLILPCDSLRPRPWW